jgi:hypothetical protein
MPLKMLPFLDGLRSGDDADQVGIFSGAGRWALVLRRFSLPAQDGFVLGFVLAGFFLESLIYRYGHGALSCRSFSSLLAGPGGPIATTVTAPEACNKLA